MGSQQGWVEDPSVSEPIASAVAPPGGAMARQAWNPAFARPCDGSFTTGRKTEPDSVRLRQIQEGQSSNGTASTSRTSASGSWSSFCMISNTRSALSAGCDDGHAAGVGRSPERQRVRIGARRSFSEGGSLPTSDGQTGRRAG
jgi:hypothetical protein